MCVRVTLCITSFLTLPCILILTHAIVVGVCVCVCEREREREREREGGREGGREGESVCVCKQDFCDCCGCMKHGGIIMDKYDVQWSLAQQA